MKACRAFWVLWITAQSLLVLSGCSRSDPDPADHATQAVKSLSRSEVEAWFADRFNASKTAGFFSDHGLRLCCEYPNIAIEFRSDHTVQIATDGWEPKRRVVTYNVGPDGQITLAIQSTDFPEAVRDDVKHVYLVPDGPDMYVTQNLTVPPDFANKNDRTWPLKYIESGDWLPPPK
jgi:hypothetical protein